MIDRRSCARLWFEGKLNGGAAKENWLQQSSLAFMRIFAFLLLLCGPTASRRCRRARVKQSAMEAYVQLLVRGTAVGMLCSREIKPLVTYSPAYLARYVRKTQQHELKIEFVFRFILQTCLTMQAKSSHPAMTLLTIHHVM